MLDIGWTELLIIAVVAIIVVGPKDLPRMLRSLGQYAGKLRRTANEFRSQFDEALRDSEFDELRSSVESVRDMNPLGEIRDAVTDGLDPLRKTADEIKSGIESEDGVREEKTSSNDDAGDTRTDDAVEDASDATEPETAAEPVSEPAPDEADADVASVNRKA